MPSVGSITKTIRINAQDREYIEGIMRENGLTWSGAIHYIIGLKDTPEEVKEYRQDLMDRAVERELIAMCKEKGISTHDFFRGALRLFKNDKLRVDGWKLRSYGDISTEKLEEVCDINNLKPQKVVDRITSSLIKQLNGSTNRVNPS